MDPVRLRRHLPSGAFLGIASALILIAAVIFVYSGVYDIAADAPHSRPVYTLLDSLRDRSITVKARGIMPPSDLNSAARVSTGAGLYTEMCAGCHVGPGVEHSELSQG